MIDAGAIDTLERDRDEILAALDDYRRADALRPRAGEPGDVRYGWLLTDLRRVERRIGAARSAATIL